MDSSGYVYGTGTYNNVNDPYDTLCLPSSCEYLVNIYDVSPFGECAYVLWEVINNTGDTLATNITCTE